MEIVLNKTSFLDVPIQVEPMHGVTFSNENKGHKFVVSCMRGGELLTLTGTVTARFMRANNTTILIAGNDYTGIVDGKAVVTLPQDCYNVPGRFQMAIFLTANGATSCIYACVGSVQRTQNGDLIDSGDAVPSLEELLAEIDACEQATADATAAANAVPGLVAETFATDKAYTAGSYVYYNGSLYRFTADHAAGAWTGSDATAVKLANDVGDLKSAFVQNVDSLAMFEDTLKVDLSRGLFQRGAINPNTNVMNDYPNRISSTREIKFPYEALLTPSSTFRFYPWLYDTDQNSWIAQGWKTVAYTVPANTGFYIQIGRRTDVSGETADILEFLAQVTVSGNPEIVSKEYADSKYATLVNLQSVSNNVADLSDDDYASRIVEGNFQDANVNLITKGKWARGAINPNVPILNDYPYRISLIKSVSFPFFANLVIKNGFRIVYYYNDGSTWVSSGWRTGTVNISENTPIYMQIARVTEDTSEIADIAEFITAVTVNGSYFDINGAEYWDLKKSLTFKYNDFEFGGWYSVGGTLVKGNTGNDRIRSKQPIPTPQSIRFIAKKDGISLYAFCMDDNNNYVGNVPSGGTKGTHRITFATRPTYKKVCAVVVSSEFTSLPSNLDDYFEIYFENDAYVKTGKQTLIYKFGGAGNDWCFVRTPENYNQFRDKPYPFVICNHGNGWTMDGTLLTSNWTNITMYWSESETGWIAGRMIDTDDESLWGSNPTIEALLAAGYVVCGCENYADAQYGNTPCRNACVDFFYHMIRRYNVEKRCYMIGASNGAMTSLNAAYILQGAVKAMVLQYPLTCLVDQYFSNTSQQAGIKTAYGIPTAEVGSEDTAENRAKLTKYLATHDPLTVDVIDGKKIGSFPPVKLYYSPDDTVTRASVNALVLYDLLDASNKVVEKVQCSGAHGDQSHFAPAEYVSWFNAH